MEEIMFVFGFFFSIIITPRKAKIENENSETDIKR